MFSSNHFLSQRVKSIPTSMVLLCYWKPIIIFFDAKASLQHKGHIKNKVFWNGIKYCRSNSIRWPNFRNSSFTNFLFLPCLSKFSSIQTKPFQGGVYISKRLETLPYYLCKNYTFFSLRKHGYVSMQIVQIPEYRWLRQLGSGYTQSLFGAHIQLYPF